jgi:hypothetical protein
MSAVKAIGPMQGDYLSLENKWAHVVIIREDESGSHAARSRYIVTGDTVDGVVTFESLERALGYAYRSLAIYQQGRAS